MRFIKMHGAGNDYVYVDCFEEQVPRNPDELAIRISDRHTGVGADGLILILPSRSADARMRMWNADGSEAEMCGNGIRCVGRYLFDSGRVARNPMRIETAGGPRELRIGDRSDPARSVRVEMGPPILAGKDIPTTLPGDPPLDVPLQLPATDHETDGSTRPVVCISMGNPHCVLFADDWTDAQVGTLGPAIERHPAFPERTNVGFAVVESPESMRLRVWERGSGETRACGTGACAAVVAGVLSGRTGRSVVCRLPGGDLHVEWTTTGPVSLSGPAIEVFRGIWPTE